MLGTSRVDGGLGVDSPSRSTEVGISVRIKPHFMPGAESLTAELFMGRVSRLLGACSGCPLRVGHSEIQNSWFM